MQPDQVLFGVYVGSSLTTSLDDVLAALKGSGITIANFSGVNTNGVLNVVPVPPQTQPTLQWAFGLPVPFSQMKATVTSLTLLQQSIAQANSGLTLSFQVQGTQVSAALQRSQSCNILELIAEATAQAQKLASAAGFVAGPILAMSSATSNPTENNSVPAFAGVGSFGTPLLTSPQNCVLMVKFSLLRF